MKEVIEKTVAALRQQNLLLAQQQSITVALLAYWEKVNEELATGGIVINDPSAEPAPPAAPTEAIAASTEPALVRHNPQTDKWVRETSVQDTFAKTEAASGTDQVAKILQEAREAQAPDSERDRLLNAADEMKKAAAQFGLAFKTNHGRPPAAVEEPTTMPTVEEPPLVTDIQGDMRSLINQFLSPGISMGGRGFVAPTPGGRAKQMQEDIKQTALSRLIDWPTAFYRNRATGAQQLLLNTNGLLIIVSGLNVGGEMGEVGVYDIKARAFVSDEYLNATPNMKKIVLDTIKWEMNKLVDPIK